MNFQSIRNRLTRGRTKLPRRPHSRSRILGVEMLEERRVLSTFFVDNGVVDCPNATFTSIQAAVTAAGTNDKIIVCKGTYIEQVIINSSKDGLELRAKNTHQAVIQAPAGTVVPAIVHVDGAEDVEIIGFKITGPMTISSSSPPPQAGIFVGGGGSATIERNHITKIRNEPVNGNQNGFGILVGRSSGGGEIGTAEIKRNLIDNYQKGGIFVDFLGSDAEIEDNEIIGIGPTSVIAQVGIQVSNGATAEVEKNEVSDNQYTGPDNALGAGIVVFDSGRTKVKNNELEDNDVGIDVFNNDTKIDISHNEVERSLFIGISLQDSTKVEVSNNTIERSGVGGPGLVGEGIVLLGSNGNTISNNRVERSVLSGIVIFESHDNRIKNNRTERNGLDGILVEDSDDNELKNNRSERNGRDGIRVTGTSSGNRLTSNKAKKNVEHDCHDETLGGGTAGTANFWKNNSGDKENVSGLCD